MAILFPKSLTIEACEKFVSQLGESETDDLLLPIDTARTAFGGLAAAIQAVNTWARLSRNRRIVLRQSQKSPSLSISEASRRPHKFAGAMLAKEIVSEANGTSSEMRSLVNRAAREAIELQASSPYGQQLGSLCWFAFVDHSTKGFDPNFYIEETKGKSLPRQLPQLKAVLKAMLEKSSLVAGGAQPIKEPQLEDLGRMFFELFLNTHEHGSRARQRKDWIRPGVRVIYTNCINLSAADVSVMIKDEPALTNYLSSQLPDQNGRYRFAEISIVDSGLGYYERWHSDKNMKFEGPFTLNDEYETFKKCFSFRQTSSGEDNKGNGLPVVMDRLTKLRGLMKVRSGRLSLFRNFIVDPYKLNDNCDFSDWNTHFLATQELTEMTPVAGVGVTLLVPLEAK
ncbi:hypothetical protein ACN9MU_01390 [Pseudoduganella sp. R-32]|uniref:hypothetical protein n=1 Tax=Pseudoduganella sp. R-32 TaxID=3404061 RepID=UPI003CEBA1C7